jgi:Kinesin-associated microtubule-binding
MLFKEPQTKLSLFLQNDALIEQLNVGRAKNLDQDAKHSQSVITNNQLMDTMQQLLQTVNTQFKEIRKHSQEESTNTADFLRCTMRDWDESTGLAVSTSSLLTTSNLTNNSNCQELAAQLDKHCAEICTLPQQQIVQVKQILQKVQKVDEDMSTCIQNGVQAMNQEFAASENSYKINLDHRTKAAEEHALSQKSVLDVMALQLEEFEQLTTAENAMKKREGDTQMALTQQALEKAKQAAGQWGDVVDSQMHNLQSQVCHFVDVELKEYLPTGVTPARTNRDYPRELKFTSPAARILARHYAEVERIQDVSISRIAR